MNVPDAKVSTKELFEFCRDMQTQLTLAVLLKEFFIQKQAFEHASGFREIEKSFRDPAKNPLLIPKKIRFLIVFTDGKYDGGRGIAVKNIDDARKYPDFESACSHATRLNGVARIDPHIEEYTEPEDDSDDDS
jgi:hypothetical protein